MATCGRPIISEEVAFDLGGRSLTTRYLQWNFCRKRTYRLGPSSSKLGYRFVHAYSFRDYSRLDKHASTPERRSYIKSSWGLHR